MIREIQREDDFPIKKKYSIAEIQEFLENDKEVPGIEEYDDMPVKGDQLMQSESKIQKIKKPWETKDNLEKLNFLDMKDDK